jgi:endonuclease III
MTMGWESVEEMSYASANDVKVIIDDFEQDNTLELAQTLLDVATAIQNNHEGVVPQTKEGLKAIGVEEPVSSLLMQQVYASSELVVSLHTRKILVALDMVDWEEVGVENKSEVKMSKVTAEKVRRSVRTWLPKGEAAKFHDTLDSIGNLVASKNLGDWGKIQHVISIDFSLKARETLVGMTQAIFQFYKATKTRRTKKSSQDMEDF